ncbi:MAG: anti-sigma factor family protein [Solirubrobacteraceae bacterium]
MRLPTRHSRTGAALERDLAHLADGTLDPSRRRRVEQLVARSPELQARLHAQRRAVSATRSLAKLERAPVALHTRYRALVSRQRRRRAPAVALALASIAGVLAWTVAALGGGQAALTVAQAATIALRPATAGVAEPASDDHVALPGVQADGMPFPYWEDHFGWHATGERTDHMAGRLLTTVFYRRGAERIAYTIVSGSALPPAQAVRTTVRAGTMLAGSWSGGRPVVTWLRLGHTCVLSGGRGVSFGALTQLAGWSSHGEIPF